MYYVSNYEVVVVGAGHAGIEAALASARLGAKTAIITLTLDAVGNMPCNPSIGGTAKGHLVFELDALGGEMGRAADATALQSRMLNLTKGPAVHSLRLQSDRRAYNLYMKRALEAQQGLDLIQDEVVELLCENGAITGLRTALGAELRAKNVVLATGTYLGGRVFVGESSRASGPDGTVAATRLTDSLRVLGLPLLRFKTGTPARVHRRSIDFSVLERQPADQYLRRFDFMREDRVENRVDCYIAYTNERTHEVIRRNLHRSPLYGGSIVGVGPRYCPSIEDKVVRFPDRPRHQMFIEPCGAETDEMYLQGMSSSLPLDVQVEMYRTIRGLEQVEIMRPAYAIEYDCCDPQGLWPSLESRVCAGLFGAGQFNGTSGYEEAAVQGLVAGVNAARRAKGLEPISLPRSGSYIGALIDDLVVKGVQDPYRMMTSRSEYRLLLRQDNADRRLCELGHEIGLLSEEKYARFLENRRLLENELSRMRRTALPKSERLNQLLESRGMAPAVGALTVEQLLKRPGITYSDIEPFDSRQEAAPPRDIIERAAVEIKYEGYLKRQNIQIERQHRLEQQPIPRDFDYSLVEGLRLEARDKLQRIKPASMGQASRISGVNPADMAVLSIFMAKWGKKR